MLPAMGNPPASRLHPATGIREQAWFPIHGDTGSGLALRNPEKGDQDLLPRWQPLLPLAMRAGLHRVMQVSQPRHQSLCVSPRGTWPERDPPNGLLSLGLGADHELRSHPWAAARCTRPQGAGLALLPGKPRAAQGIQELATTRDVDCGVGPERDLQRQRILTTSDQWAGDASLVGQTAARTPTPTSWAKLTSV